MTTSIYREEFPELFSFIDEGKVPVRYFPEARRFALKLPNSPVYQEIFYCPWTGRKLPDSVRDAFAEILAGKGLSILEPENWPSELRGETWWLNAGL